ncbi:MAG TPA: carboxylesterase family protein [Polyangiales bacterium]|nr:carboxylesterase family protein [Polyangiales bacterium]
MVGLGWLHRGKTVLAAAGALALHAAAAHADNGAVVTDNGPVKGVETSAGKQYLGIPYAAPPVGSLRWMPPQAAPRWHGVLNAKEFAPNCAQPGTPFGIASTSEDCLYLNVFTPDNKGKGKAKDCDEDNGGKGKGNDKKCAAPVMVWMHPGAFQYGASNDFDPSELVGRGVVVVTLNYRLGVLGWLSHPALTAESASATSGNYGLQDQQAALRWVQRNIDRFGGDTNNVTIFGESAGAVSVHAHMAAPSSAGLFHRAIAQSGGYALTQPTLASAEQLGSAFATQVGCTGQDAACLRALPVTTILANQSTSPTAYLPKVDGSILPVSVATAFATGQFNRVPVIEGSTHDEFTLFVATQFELRGTPVTAANYPFLVAAVLGVPLPTAQFIANNFYPLALYPNPSRALAAIGTDAAFACNTRVAARLLAQWVPTWAYEFSDATAPQVFLPPVSFAYGSYHGSEVQYLFDVRAAVPAPPLNAQQLALADSMQSYWTSFAKAADPNGGSVPAWGRYQPTTLDNFQSFRTTGPVAYTGTAFGADHKCAVWGSP